jgi:hypothetical protein
MLPIVFFKVEFDEVIYSLAMLDEALFQATIVQVYSPK